MSTLEIILTCSTSLLAAITGGAGILFYKERKHLQQAEATRVDVDNELKQADWAMEQLRLRTEIEDEIQSKSLEREEKLQEKLLEQTKMLVEMQSEFIKMQGTIVSNTDRIAMLEKTIIILEEKRCDRVDCDKRIPVKKNATRATV